MHANKNDNEQKWRLILVSVAVATVASWIGCVPSEKDLGDLSEAPSIDQEAPQGGVIDVVNPSGGEIPTDPSNPNTPGDPRQPDDTPPPADPPTSPRPTYQTFACLDATGAPVLDATCDIGGACVDALGQTVPGALCNQTATICVDALGVEIPGAVCGADNICRDVNNNIIEGICQEVTIPICAPGLSLSTSTSTSASDSLSTSTSTSTSNSCSTSTSNSTSTSASTGAPLVPGGA